MIWWDVFFPRMDRDCIAKRCFSGFRRFIGRPSWNISKENWIDWRRGWAADGLISRRKISGFWQPLESSRNLIFDSSGMPPGLNSISLSKRRSHRYLIYHQTRTTTSVVFDENKPISGLVCERIEWARLSNANNAWSTIETIDVCLKLCLSHRPLVNALKFVARLSAVRAHTH